MKKSKHYTKGQLLGFKRRKAFIDLKISLLDKTSKKVCFRVTKVWVGKDGATHFEVIPKVPLEEVKLHWMEGISEEDNSDS